MSVIFATQLTAVATLALALLALATAVLALLAWRKQSREVRDQAEMLQLQAEEFRQLADGREREALERHRAQAVQVYMWVTIEGDELVAHAWNTSDQPVYQAAIQRGPEGAVLWREPFMPGMEVSSSRPWLEEAPSDDSQFTLTFRDRAGAWWATWPGGRLEELPEAPKLRNVIFAKMPPRTGQ